MSKNQELSFNCDLMLFGRGLIKKSLPNGAHSYAPTKETVQCAHEAGLFWEKYRRFVRQIICSGGYPQLAGHMQRPGNGANEATMMATILRNDHHVTCDIHVEPDSGHTFANVSNSLKAGFLQSDKYNPNHRLGIVANEAHAPRVILLTRFALNISLDSLFRVAPLAPERDLAVIKKERLLAKLTQIVIDDTIKEGFLPGTPGCIDEAFSRFDPLWNDREHRLSQFEAEYGKDWMPQDTLVI